jgi:hypothetical protein
MMMMPPQQAGGNKGVIIGIVVLLILLLVVAGAVVLSRGSTETPAPVVGQTPPPLIPSNPVATSTTRNYVFYPGKDSGGNDIKQSAADANNVDKLKATCDNTGGCVGFNTNGWLKHTIKPQASWTTWTTDPNKGMWTLAEQFEQHVNWL